jgi:two-component system, sensor histidine kinase and response regulator
MRRLRIRQRLFGIIVLGGIGLVAVGAVFVVRLHHVSQTLRGFNVEIQQHDQARLMQVQFKKQVQEWKNILLRGHDPADLQRYRAAFLKESETVRIIGEGLARTATDPKARDLIGRFLDAHHVMGRAYGEALERFVAGNGLDPKSADTRVRGQDRAPTDLIDQIVAQIGVIAHVDAQEAAIRRDRRTISVVVVGLLALLVAVSAVVSRSITRPLAETVNGLERVAAGDLRHRLAIVGEDEVTRMNRALNATVDAIERTDERLRDAVVSAEAASRAKSEFLANMSHEIRTPMNGIIGMTELTLDTEITGEQREYLGAVKTSADALLTIINDILDFSKIEAGKLEFDSVEFRLRDCLGDALKAVAVRADAKGLELAYDVAPDVPDVLEGDPGRLRQVILNLVGNAIKFTEVGEVILHVEVDAPVADGAVRLRFTVTDTGIGIPPEKQAQIFQPFTQADSSSTRLYGGTGLGLTICAQLVARMGGTITVESAVGRGSVFRFDGRFRVAQASTAPPALPPALDGLRVLIVDDNATNRRILEGTVRHWAMRPTAVGSAADGLAAIAAAPEPFSLILLDANMPGMDGFMFAERLGSLSRAQQATIMMLSSAGQRGDASRCRELGIKAYLLKPLKRSELLRAIVATLSTSSQEPPHDALVTRHTMRQHRTALRVLLAEDNLVNQRLASRLLEKEGHEVTVAPDGSKAVEAWSRAEAAAPFDLVLMDVQMPVMDGFQATAAIRQEERNTGRHVSIVAMTAHAMQGDRERCLAAGMDDYLSKPLVMRDLLELLARRSAGKLLARAPEPEVAEEARAAAWNQDVALARMDGDRAILEEVITALLESAPGALAAMREAVEAGDPVRVAHAAHAMKGAVANVAASGALAATTRLEDMGRAGDLSGAAEQFRALEHEMRVLIAALRAFVEPVRT